jgi:hypothetical protein
MTPPPRRPPASTAAPLDLAQLLRRLQRLDAKATAMHTTILRRPAP